MLDLGGSLKTVFFCVIFRHSNPHYRTLIVEMHNVHNDRMFSIEIMPTLKTFKILPWYDRTESYTPGNLISNGNLCKSLCLKSQV